MTSDQSGDEEAEDRAERAESKWGGWYEGRSSIASTRSLDWTEEATNAAGACRTALRWLIPPRLLGREAFDQDQLEMGPLTMAFKVSLMEWSKSLAAWAT